MNNLQKAALLSQAADRLAPTLPKFSRLLSESAQALVTMENERTDVLGAAEVFREIEELV
jgi:hypothetical protein